MTIVSVGIDLAKNVFAVHGVGGDAGLRELGAHFVAAAWPGVAAVRLTA